MERGGPRAPCACIPAPRLPLPTAQPGLQSPPARTTIKHHPELSSLGPFGASQAHLRLQSQVQINQVEFA